MKVFISSVIAGMESYRDAAERAIRQLSHAPLRAEEFGASPDSPRIACLNGVRQADAVILLMGDRYGDLQSSGLSATHEEYHEARDRCPVLVMVQRGIEPEPEQGKFITEVQDWADGHYTASFHDPDSLLDASVGALHSLVLATATGPVDPDEMLQRAEAILPKERVSYHGGGASLAIALTGGPQQTIIRPTQLEEQSLRDTLQQLAMFGDAAILDRRAGTDDHVEGDELLFVQDHRSFALREDGSISCTSEIQTTGHGLAAIIEENIQEDIEKFLRFANAVLTEIDPRNRLSHCVIATKIIDAGYATWRTRAEHAASPNSMNVNVQGNGETSPVSLLPPHRTRSAIRLNAAEVAEDLTVKLRRALLNPKRDGW